MIEPFMIKALIAGLLLCLATGPLGCFVVWRRMAYFGDTLAHSALLGVALSFLIGTQIQVVGVLFVCLLLALCLNWFQKQQWLAEDSALGILSHTSLALGLVVATLLPNSRLDLIGYLFGDILSVSTYDIYLIAGSVLIIGIFLLFKWRQLLLLTIDQNLAKADGISVTRLNLMFVIFFALLVALAIKAVGILLMTSLLIIPAAAARSFARSPTQMAILAILAGWLSVILGLTTSYHYDVPTGPLIVLSSALLFILSLFWRVHRRRTGV